MNLAKKADIISVKQIAERTTEVSLRVPDTFTFRAGQWIWLAVPELKYPDPRGNTRMFSIASSPDKKGVVEIIFRNSDSGFKKTLTELPTGSEVLFSGPYGHLNITEDEPRPIVFLAGGMGVAPFLSIIRSLNTRQNNISLVYTNTRQEEAAYINELIQIEKDNPNFRLINVFGKLTSEYIEQAKTSEAAVWYVMGPRGFVNVAAEILKNAGVSAADINYEQFYPDTPAGEQFKKQIEAAQKTNDPYLLAVNSASDHIVITDTNGIILYANKGAELTTGYTLDEMLGNTPRLWGGLMPPALYKDLWKTKKELLQTFTTELKNRRKDQTEYYAILHASPVLNSDNVLMGFVATEEDITKLKELDIAKSDFISTASHQLRTPIVGMRWMIDLLTKKEKLTLKGEQYLHDLSISAQRLGALVNLLLNASRIESGKVTIISKQIEIVSMINEAIREHKEICDQKGLTVTLAKHPDKIDVTTDQNLLDLVVQNLLDNAVNYTPKGGKIDVSLEKTRDNFILSVQDSGIGIPKDEQSKIFERFRRATNATKMKTDGTGLGLYIASETMKVLGGKIWFESEEGKGTTFHIEVPLELSINK